MAAVIPTYEELLRTGVHLFITKFKKKPTSVGCAPGRVNLIGEHVDYNNGFVFPIAVPMVTMVIGAENESLKINLFTDVNVKESCTAAMKIPDQVDLVPGEPKWANYVKGVICYFQEAYIPGFDAVIISSIPLDSGLGGSAALEVATYNFLEDLTGVKTKDLSLKIALCQNAEHTFANTPCGIMDQFTSVFAEKGYAILLDCSNLTFNQIPFSDPNVAVLIVHPHIGAKSMGNRYANRRELCYAAAKQMNLESLREGGTRDLQKYRSKMQEELFRLARHVITEILRTIDAAQSLKFKDYASFGLLMLQSQNSLRILAFNKKIPLFTYPTQNDFDASIPAIDELVEVTMKADGVYGTRMSGSGFGGCTISLVKSTHVRSIIKYITENYGKNAEFYNVTASGASINLKPMLGIINAEIDF